MLPSQYHLPKHILHSTFRIPLKRQKHWAFGVLQDLWASCESVPKLCHDWAPQGLTSEQSLGLILGGVLTNYLGWRWIFWISLILSCTVIFAALLMLPRRPVGIVTIPSVSTGNGESSDEHVQPPKKFMHSLRERVIRFDIIGISLGLPGILLLTYSLTTANTSGWGASEIIVTLVLAIVLLVIFALYERSASQAILAPHLFKSTSFNLSLVLAVNTYAVRQACTYFLTVQLQSYGNTPIHTSVLYLPLGISALITNTSAGRLVPILGARFMVN